MNDTTKLKLWSVIGALSLIATIAAYWPIPAREGARPPTAARPASALSEPSVGLNGPAFPAASSAIGHVAIQSLRPLDRVLVDAPQAALDADPFARSGKIVAQTNTFSEPHHAGSGEDSRPGSCAVATPGEERRKGASGLAERDRSSSMRELTDPGPATHKLLRIRCEWTWPGGTVDDINVRTVQSNEWCQAVGARVGAEVPLPVDLVEMGMPSGLTGTVLSIEQCPQPPPGPGRLVLTTVNHLNRDVIELDLCGPDGHIETLRPTGTHKFYSATRNAWLSASQLRQGEQLDSLAGPVTVVAKRTLSGTHRVYNLTVQGEHLYRVAQSGVLVHNNRCSIPRVADGKLKNIVNDLYKGARTRNPIGTGSTADAVRNELLTGLPARGRFHSTRAREYIRALEKWLQGNPNAEYYDRLVARSILEDLKAALAGR